MVFEISWRLRTISGTRTHAVRDAAAQVSFAPADVRSESRNQTEVARSTLGQGQPVGIGDITGGRNQADRVAGTQGFGADQLPLGSSGRQGQRSRRAGRTKKAAAGHQSRALAVDSRTTSCGEI